MHYTTATEKTVYLRGILLIMEGETNKSGKMNLEKDNLTDRKYTSLGVRVPSHLWVFST